MVISPRAPQDNLINRRFKSFRISEKGFPVNDDDSVETKLSWLRSQVIGGDAVFSTPFGIRRITYADHTATGRSLRYIEDHIINNVLPFYGNTHTSDSYIGHRTTTAAHEATEYIKHCLGGGANDALIFTGSGTTAAIKRLQEIMGIAIPSIMRQRVLQTLSKEEKWVVFVGPFEHHSNILSWRQTLAEVVEIGLNKDGVLDMEDLKHKLEEYGVSNRPMLGSFSACSNVTGVYSDTRRIATLLHQHGGFACFDFAASGPYTKIDMRSGEMDGYDAIFLSPHKFIGGPGSPGILLLTKSLYMLKSCPPSTCGGGTVDYVNGFNEKDTLYLKDIEEREDAGTPPIIQKTRAALAFRVKEYIGYKTIYALEHNYTKTALQRLLPNPSICVLGNTSENRQSIISFLVYTTTYSSPNYETRNRRDKPLHGPFVAKLLNDLFGIQARGGCACAGPYAHILLNIDESLSLDLRSAIQKGYTAVKPGWTRISFPYYMSNEEFEFILAALEFVAIYGQRFLEVYHLNWRTGAWTSKKNVTLKLFLQQNEDNEILSSAKPMMDEPKNDNNIKIEVSKIVNANDVGIVRTYASYMETAKRIACLLPKLPSQRPIPDDIDIDLLPFKV